MSVRFLAILLFFSAWFLFHRICDPIRSPKKQFFDVQHQWNLKQSCDCDKVRGNPPVCVTTSQLLLGDITTDNLT